MSDLLGQQCSCMRYETKRLIEWAIDYHLISISKEIKEAEILVEEAKGEFREITGKEPERYGIEGRISRLKKEEDTYTRLRDEIIELPSCPEPAFEVRGQKEA